MPARLGQHFLTDSSVLDAILAAAALAPGDSVIEIGPGRGFLTEGLLLRGCRVTAVEMDDRLAEGLRARFEGHQRLEVLRADFLKLDLGLLGPGPHKYVANLPYSVATPILQRILPQPNWTSATLMFQKEVAERIAAKPAGRDYGMLTLSVMAYAQAQFEMEVSRTSFSPRPKIASAVVGLKRRDPPWSDAKEEKRFFHIARAAFSQRRKMAAGLIANAAGVPKDEAAAALRACGLDERARAEDIPFEAYLKLARTFPAR